jgi:hypothetical protein
MSSRLLSVTLLSAAALTARAQLTLSQIGGTIDSGNYGTLSGTGAFGLDEIGGGGFSIHKIPNIRDGVFGNSNSWIGDSPNSFIGLNFGAATVPVNHVAWGRDNTGTFGDRTAGTYTVHYTQVPNPGTGLGVTGDPSTGWATIGSVNYAYQGNDDAAGPIAMSRRHAWNFPSVNATGIRLTAPGSSFADGAAVDELEAFSTPFSAPVSLVTTGGTMNVSTNLSLTGTAFAKDLIAGGAFPAHDSIGNLNDGMYGNENSWIGETAGSFAGVAFSASNTIERIAFGRDNTGTYGDRSGGAYVLQYTTVPGPNALTLETDWLTIGNIWLDGDSLASADRHEYSFAPVNATGVRLLVGGVGVASGRAIDELEVYAAVPEPTSTAVLLLAGLGLLRRRRA